MKSFFAKNITVEADWRGSATKFVQRLFLCSRDIQVGDTIKYKFGEIEKDMIINDQHQIDFMYPAEAFKIIGAISPEAKWVKDGDEFTENEVNWAWFPPYDEPEYYPISEFTWPQLVKQRGGYKTVPKYLPPIVAIKCPCCEDFK